MRISKADSGKKQGLGLAGFGKKETLQLRKLTSLKYLKETRGF